MQQDKMHSQPIMSPYFARTLPMRNNTINNLAAGCKNKFKQLIIEICLFSFVTYLHPQLPNGCHITTQSNFNI
jgi:hypothetical protein